MKWQSENYKNYSFGKVNPNNLKYLYTKKVRDCECIKQDGIGNTKFNALMSYCISNRPIHWKKKKENNCYHTTISGAINLIYDEKWKHVREF